MERELLKQQLIRIIQKRDQKSAENAQPKQPQGNSKLNVKFDKKVLYDIVSKLNDLKTDDRTDFSTPNHMALVANQVLKYMIYVLYAVSISPKFPQPSDMRLPKSSPFWNMHESVRDILRAYPSISEQQFVTKIQKVLIDIVTPKPVTFPHLTIIQRHLELVRKGQQTLNQVLPRIEESISVSPGFLSRPNSPLRAYIERLLKKPAPAVTLTETKAPSTVSYRVEFRRVPYNKTRTNYERFRTLNIPKECTQQYLNYYIAEQLVGEETYFGIHNLHTHNVLYGQEDDVFEFDTQPEEAKKGFAYVNRTRYDYEIRTYETKPDDNHTYFDMIKKKLVFDTFHQGSLLWNLYLRIKLPIEKAYDTIWGRMRYQQDMLLTKYRPMPLSTKNIKHLGKQHGLKGRKQDLIKELEKRNVIAGNSRGMHTKQEWNNALSSIDKVITNTQQCRNKETALHFSSNGPDVLVSTTLPITTTKMAVCISPTTTIQDVHTRLHPEILKMYPAARYCYIVCTPEDTPSLPYESLLKDHDTRPMKIQRWKLRVQIETSTAPFSTGYVDIKSNTLYPKQGQSGTAAAFFKYIQSIPYTLTILPIPAKSYLSNSIYVQITPTSNNTCGPNQKSVIFGNPHQKILGVSATLVFKHELNVNTLLGTGMYGENIKEPFTAIPWYEVCVPESKVRDREVLGILQPQIESLLGKKPRRVTVLSSGASYKDKQKPYHIHNPKDRIHISVLL